MVLYETRRFTIYIENSDLTFEYCSNGASFTLFCTLECDSNTGIINKMIVHDYDGCFDFNREHVMQAMKLYNKNIVIDFSEL